MNDAVVRRENSRGGNVLTQGGEPFPGISFRGEEILGVVCANERRLAEPLVGFWWGMRDFGLNMGCLHYPLHLQFPSATPFSAHYVSANNKKCIGPKYYLWLHP
ncbi:hypothetical protein V8G54_020261 [Vigna mungo]|uniref:Uncharacterized protein n=1 Tax=Vigna mungo TaxID=3915 RepID=A0AAQ3NBD5_VIGMU